MKIDISKEEYRALIDLLYLGEWVMNAHDTGASYINSIYESITQKIYSQAEKMSCENLISKSEAINGYQTTTEYEEGGIHGLIDQYNSDSFWEELITRLSERDALEYAKATGKDIASATRYWELSIPHEQRYSEEFEKNGLSRLRLSNTLTSV